MPDEQPCPRCDEEVIGEEFLLEGEAYGVTVTGGVVTLRGPVDNEAVGVSLLDTVRRVDGVVAVHEKLSYPALERRPHRV